jgi:hypothetical protein
MFSDRRLGLKARWFTGREWADGTAQQECRQEYEVRTTEQLSLRFEPEKPRPASVTIASDLMERAQ